MANIILLAVYFSLYIFKLLRYSIVYNDKGIHVSYLSFSKPLRLSSEVSCSYYLRVRSLSFISCVPFSFARSTAVYICLVTTRLGLSQTLADLFVGSSFSFFVQCEFLNSFFFLCELGTSSL